MNSNTNVIQVTNVSPSTTSEQMRTLFGFLGKIEELKLFPPDESPLPVTSRVCFVKFLESESVGVSQHLTNTVFVDRALIVVPFAEGVIPDETKALSLLAPANAVAGMLPGGGLLPTPNPLASWIDVSQMGGVPLGAMGGPTLDPALAALGLQGSNMNPQSLTADQLLKLMTSVDPKLNHMAAGLNMNPGMKADTSNKEIEEAMKRVREAQSLISAAIEPGNKKDDKRKHSRSRSRSRRRRSRSRSRHRRSKSRSRRRTRSRSKRRSKSPRRRKSHSKDRSRRSRSKSRDRKKEKEVKKRSKTPPKSYSTTRRSRSISRRRRRSRSATRSPKKSRSPKRKLSRSPSPRRHKKEKKKDKERERERDRGRKEEKDRSREVRERSTSKKKKSKDKEKEREKKSDTEKGDVKRSKHGLLQPEMTIKAEVNQVTRDYDEEEQGYDSEKEKEEKIHTDQSESPKPKEPSVDKTEGGVTVKESKVNGDDHHEEDMEMSD
ncbi:serine/arginine-rich splicing factor 11-like isoform X2 [Anguilla anguilla]|uniref:serine/arginine-rich splicing factor 11-like isoform X2 n=1 Tax=Anguilla anguilla TaxID=7936 RepID=UPI0015A90742|nr:serine/arginine-rich splicing factor 11-like isoform X2 [Anguilla anguilla]